MAEKVFESVATKQLEVGTEQFQAGKTGRPAFFFAKTNATLGGWFNASKSYMDYMETGDVTGRGSAHNMEMRMPNKTIQRGQYSPAEHNLVFQASSGITNGRTVTFASYNVSGTQAKIDAWEDNANTKGAFIDINGLSSGDGSIFETQAPGVVDACLKILINGTPYWISLSSAHD